MDFVVVLTGAWENPYRSTEVALDLELLAPSGRRLTVPGYYEQGASGKPSVWRVRYAPAEVGAYSGKFVLKLNGERLPPVPASFEVAPSASKGFLHVAGPWVFRFDNGEPFRGIGENICWEARSQDDSRYFKALNEHPRFTYEYLLGQLSANGGNFFRTWMCPWNLPLEWPHVIDTARYRDDSAPFNRSAIERMDQLLEICGEADVYFMLTLDAHGALLGGLWDINAYNARNGGPAATPEGFFTDPKAKARYKDRLRYLVARWGWSPHLAAWEFFNEIDNAMYGQKPERIPDRVIVDWHAEMSAYLKSIDPYGRLVTTSVSHRDVAGLNRVPGLDFSQRHIYRNTPSIPETLRKYVRAEGKPYVIGEFAFEWDWSKDFNLIAGDMDRDYKLGLWLGLFSPTPILPMSWWWEFFDERHLTSTLGKVRSVQQRMFAAGHGSFQEAECRWLGTPTPAYGVRCGDTTFVLLVNSTGAEASGELILPELPPQARSIQDYDTERGAFGETRKLTLSKTGSIPVRIAGDRCLVLVIGPTPR